MNSELQLNDSVDDAYTDHYFETCKNKKLTISNYLYRRAKENYFIYFNESTSKMMKKAFHFILKAFFRSQDT